MNEQQARQYAEYIIRQVEYIEQRIAEEASYDVASQNVRPGIRN